MPIDKRIRHMPLPIIHPTNREIDGINLNDKKDRREDGKEINQRYILIGLIVK